MIYQYFSLTHHAAYRRAAAKWSDYPISPVLDLEDSVGSLEAPELAASQKRRARQGLLSLMCSGGTPLPFSDRINIRINAHGSDFWNEDMALLEQIALDSPHPFSVHLPKVSDEGAVQAFISTLSPRARGSLRDVCVLVEDSLGIRRVERILAAMPGGRKVVTFGFFDYMLSEDIFPIWECDGMEMASFVGDLSKRLVREGAVYGHCVVPNLEANRLRSVCAMLQNVCECAFALTSISIGQSTAYLETAIAADPLGRAPRPSPEDWAWKVTGFFQHERQRKKSFGVMNDYFVSPQEFQLASRYLRSRGEGA